MKSYVSLERAKGVDKDALIDIDTDEPELPDTEVVEDTSEET